MATANIVNQANRNQIRKSRSRKLSIWPAIVLHTPIRGGGGDFPRERAATFLSLLPSGANQKGK